MPRSEKVSYGVARAIVSDAAADGVDPGTVLGSEAEMMSRYEVSRGSVREALRILEVLGFIELKRGQGGGPVLLDADVSHFSTVATLFYQRLGVTYAELLDLRLVLEPAAAARCAERPAPRDERLLRGYLRDSSSIDLQDDRSFRGVGQGFHQLITDMSGNRLLSVIARSCHDVFAGRAAEFVYPPKKHAGVVAAHDSIAEAILDRNPDKARLLMASHIRDYVAHANTQFLGLMREVVRW